MQGGSAAGYLYTSVSLCPFKGLFPKVSETPDTDPWPCSCWQRCSSLFVTSLDRVIYNKNGIHVVCFSFANRDERNE